MTSTDVVVNWLWKRGPRTLFGTEGKTWVMLHLVQQDKQVQGSKDKVVTQ